MENNSGSSILIAFIVLIVLVLLGVGGYYLWKRSQPITPTPTTPTNPPNVTVVVTPNNINVVRGQQVRFTATVTPVSGETISGNVTWSVNDTQLATINNSGLLTAIGTTGNVIVTATSVDKPDDYGTATVTLINKGFDRVVKEDTNESADKVVNNMDMMCADGSYVTSVFGSANYFLDNIGIQCSDGKRIDSVGAATPVGNPFTIMSDGGIDKLKLGANKWNVTSLQFSDKDNKNIGSLIGRNYADTKFTDMVCGPGGRIIGLHGDYTDYYKRLGITCGY